MDVGPVLLIVLVAAVVIAAIVYGVIWERKRRKAFADVASRLGFRFSPEKDHELARQYGFLDRLAQGSNRYAFNVLSGAHDGSPVLIFDYHYATHSTDSKGRTRTQHHYLSFFILTLPRHFPELTIAREGIFSKIAQAFGYDDIDFESHEFSKRFCVRSKDKKFAYDVCHARMIEYLLENRDLSLEIEGPALAMGFSRRLAPERIEPNLRRLLEIRARIPDYVLAGP
jgi:hypothetical protein